MGKSGRRAMNASVASSIASIASRATVYFGRDSPGAVSRIEPEVSMRIATAAPSPSSTSAWYGADSASRSAGGGFRSAGTASQAPSAAESSRTAANRRRVVRVTGAQVCIRAARSLPSGSGAIKLAVTPLERQIQRSDAQNAEQRQRAGPGAVDHHEPGVLAGPQVHLDVFP